VIGRKRTSPRAAWRRHDGHFRDPHEVVAQWQRAAEFDRSVLAARTRGPWWDLLGELKVTLIVTREYEHLVCAMSAQHGAPRTSFLRLPHPNGLAFDPGRGRLHVASTRNPNILFEFAPARGAMPGATPASAEQAAGILLPAGARYLPGSLYLHDLALVGGELHGCAAGMNAVVRLVQGGGFEPVWWPRVIDGPPGGLPRFERNYLQLNSIAAGLTLRSSYFTASAPAPGRRRPGHVSFPVDRRGVVFSGRDRTVVAGGLTRPHSARHSDGRLWVDNSGYGELVVVDGGRPEPIARLPGWTRGLCFAGGVAFVATSRVIPRFRCYAPGLDVQRSSCGVHAVDTASGKAIASVTWPSGNQIFAVEAVPATWTRGFPFAVGEPRAERRLRELFSTATF
jgi:uncharacterized protein (TIGR03032 family)